MLNKHLRDEIRELSDQNLNWHGNHLL
jgi:hypothetical protein